MTSQENGNEPLQNEWNKRARDGVRGGIERVKWKNNMKIKRNVEKRREKNIAHKKYQLFARVCVFVCVCMNIFVSIANLIQKMVQMNIKTCKKHIKEYIEKLVFSFVPNFGLVSVVIGCRLDSHSHRISHTICLFVSLCWRKMCFYSLWINTHCRTIERHSFCNISFVFLSIGCLSLSFSLYFAHSGWVFLSWWFDFCCYCCSALRKRLLVPLLFA